MENWFYVLLLIENVLIRYPVYGPSSWGCLFTGLGTAILLSARVANSFDVKCVVFNMIVFAILLLQITQQILGKTSIPIAGIFDENDYEVEVSFRSAIERENMYNKHIEFVPKIIKADLRDSLVIEKKVCEILPEGIGAIFGPNSASSVGIVSSISNTFEIPHIVTTWLPDDNIQTDEYHQFTTNFFPENNLYSRLLAEVIVSFGWKSFTILYDNQESFMRLQDVLQIHEPGDVPISVKEIGPGPDYRPLLKEILTSGETHVVLDCKLDLILEILRQGKDVNMLEEYQNYLITTIDAHTLDFAELKFVRANITSVRMMDLSSFDFETAVHDWTQSEIRRNRSINFDREHIRTEAALMNDAVKLVTNVIKETHAMSDISTTGLKCNLNGGTWSHGSSLKKAIDEKTEYGMTGRTVFDDNGKRKQFYFEVIEMSMEGFKKISVWDPVNGLQTTRNFSELYSQISHSLQNKEIIVASRIGMPFLGLKTPEDGEVLEGNDRYEGYSVDLIDSIARMLGFRYRFELTPDNKYGSYNKITKKWDGLVKQILDRKADLAICDLTITYERRTAVDFTMPFMTLGISILFAKPIKQPPDLFSFLSPLSLDVWIYMGTAYLGISLLLFILSRAAPDDWECPHPCDKDPEEVENIWTLTNCTWLTVGSIMGQGCDILPKAISTRLAAGMWWFFALIMLSSYTANLAAFLTMERMDVSIESVEDLAKQSKIKYGAVLGGSTLAFFKGSNFSLYQRMWSAMESTEPSVFVKDNKEGEERVAKSKRLYAFFMESTSLEYIIERNCNLTQIGGLLDSKGYGIAMPVNSPYRTHISQTVLKMQEEGKLHRLKTKWWKELNGGGSCTADVADASDSAAELGIENVGGVFVVLGFGCFAACIIGLLEFLWNVKKVAVEEKITPMEALKSEAIFALDIRITAKPVRCSKSKSSSCRNSKESINTISSNAVNMLKEYK